jgi:hypothetical protein
MKHKFEGIGETTAAIIMAGLAANPSTLFLTQGILGKIVFRVSKYFCMMLANLGLIVMNLGAAKIEVLVDEGNYNGSWEQAEELLKKIRDQGRGITDEEIKDIDAPVIDAFRKFASFGRVRQRRDT